MGGIFICEEINQVPEQSSKEEIMACWRKLENGVLVGGVLNTRLGQKIVAEGDYVLLTEPSGLHPRGATVVGAAWKPVNETMLTTGIGYTI